VRSNLARGTLNRLAKLIETYNLNSRSMTQSAKKIVYNEIRHLEGVSSSFH